jgi:hypothetical protein
LESLKRRDQSDDVSVDGIIILKWILKRKYGSRVWTGLIWLRIGTGTDSCEHGNKPSGSIKPREFLE